jgi:hypothetical protein
MIEYPEPSYSHLLHLSDDIGLYEHACGTSPRPEHGYCLDDVARGLVVICREPAPSSALVVQAGRYLRFIVRAQAIDGTFHNRLGHDRRWQDRPDTGDWWGRALWGLGTAAARVPGMRPEALSCFDKAARCRSRWPRTMAFAALGAAEILAVQPDHEPARRLLADAATTIGRPGHEPGWPWPEPRLSYANAALAEALIAAGQYLECDATATDGLNLLAWLLETETRDGHLSLTPVGGWRSPQQRPAFDQQPIEAAALADACARALTLTGDRSWAEGLRLAAAWFLGDNDAKIEMCHPATGGGCDGLESAGRNENQGAESTLALLSTLQHARQISRVRAR